MEEQKNDNTLFVLAMIVIVILLIWIYNLYSDINHKESTINNFSCESYEKELSSCKEEKEELESKIEEWWSCDDYCENQYC